MANKNFTVKNGLEVGGQEVITSAGVLTNSAFPTALAPTFTDLTLTGSLFGTLASSVTGTTQSAGDNSTKIATTAYIATAVANLVDSSPTTLDTLNELAAALGDDPNFATTTATSLGLKAPLASPNFTGTVNISASQAVLTIASSSTSSGNEGELLLSHAGHNSFEIKGGSDLAFSSDGGVNERVRITNAGNVGIGTNAPVSKLHVSGNITIDSSSNAPYLDFVENGDTGDSKARIAMDQISGTAGQMLFYTEDSGTLSERMRIGTTGEVTLKSAGVVTLKAAPLGSTYGGGFNAMTVTGTSSSPYTSTIGFGNYGVTDAMVIQGGNVGIGNTNPQHKIHFGEGGGYYTSIGSGNSVPGGATPWLGIFNNTSIASATYGWGFYDSSADGSLQIWNKDSSTTGAVALTIKRGGNVGINHGLGGGAINSKLSVFADGEAIRLDGTANTSRTLRFRNAATNGSGNAIITSDGILQIKTEDANAHIYMNSVRDIAMQTTSLNGTAGHFTFSSYNTEIMRIDGGSNRVGIGTTAPNTNLVVYHTTDDTSINVNTGTGGSYPKKTGISFGAISTSLGGDATFTGGAGIQAINTAASGNPTNLVFWTNSVGTPAERMRITSNGSVGIGTSSFVDTNARLVVSNGTIDLEHYLYNAASIGYIGTRTNHNLGFTSNGQERMRIDNGGQVGIGCSPTQKLEVNGSIRVTSGTSIGYFGAGSSFAGGAATDFALRSDNALTFASGGPYERMHITSGGNVGIGTSSPTANLSVGSTTTATGDVTLRTTKTTFSITPSNTDAGGVELGVGWVAGGQGPMKFSVGTEKMRIDSSGNVGIGVVPSAWGSLWKASEIGLGAGFGGRTNGTQADVYENLYRDATNAYKYKTSAAASVYTQVVGNFIWSNAGVGTAGATATMTERMTLNASGNLGLGVVPNTGWNSTYKALQVGASGALWSNTSSSATLLSNNTVFNTNGSRYRLVAGAAAELYLTGSGAFDFRSTATSGAADAIISDMATKMTLDASGNLYFSGNLQPAGNIIAPSVYANYTGGSPNLVMYSGGIIQRTGSSLRYKNTINDATHGLAELLTLRPVTYKGNNDGDTIFGGLIAEEVHDAGLTEFVQYGEEGEPDGLGYGNMVSLCIKAIQEQQAIIESLTARIAALE